MFEFLIEECLNTLSGEKKHRKRVLPFAAGAPCSKRTGDNPKGGILMVRAIVGANWGDEGKGKITDMLAKESDIIIRLIITASLPFIFCLPVYFTSTLPVLSETEWH